MKKFICKFCGYVHEGDAAPEVCPKCKRSLATGQKVKKS